MKEKNDINFEAKDFERYYSGVMTGKEMYDLEKAALADPFLQEALDGYQHTDKAVSDVVSLQEKLNSRLTEKKEAKIVLWNKNNFLKAAILIAFLAGSAYVLLKQNNNRVEKSNLASTNPAEIKEALVDSNLLASKNELPVQDAAPTASAPTPVIDLKKNKVEAKISDKKNQAKANKSNATAMLEQSSQDEIVVAAAPVLRAENKDDSYLIKGKVVNEQGEPIPFASIVTNKEQINTDISGNYSAYIKDSSLYGNVVASGYQPQQKKLSPNLSQTITLGTAIAKAETVAESEKAFATKKSEEKIRENNSAKAQSTIINNILNPKDGWPKYEQYLKDSVRYQSEKRAVVQISFTVNELGRPQEIKIIDGICLPCNNEAIRLLKEGPDWKPLLKGKGLLKVQF